MVHRTYYKVNDECARSVRNLWLISSMVRIYAFSPCKSRVIICVLFDRNGHASQLVLFLTSTWLRCALCVAAVD
jgi:hypothetical protein